MFRRLVLCAVTTLVLGMGLAMPPAQAAASSATVTSFGVVDPPSDPCVVDLWADVANVKGSGYSFVFEIWDGTPGQPPTTLLDRQVVALSGKDSHVTAQFVLQSGDHVVAEKFFLVKGTPGKKNYEELFYNAYGYERTCP